MIFCHQCHSLMEVNQMNTHHCDLECPMCRQQTPWEARCLYCDRCVGCVQLHGHQGACKEFAGAAEEVGE